MKFRVKILEQTREIDIDIPENASEAYLNGCLDANIFPQDQDRQWTEPLGENAGLDGLLCTIERI